MKKVIYSMVMLATALVVSCSPDSDNDYTSNSSSTTNSSSQSGNSSSSSSTTTITSETSADLSSLLGMSISTDESRLSESESIPSDESDTYYDDYVEHTSFAETVDVVYSGNSATVSSSDNVEATVDGADVYVQLKQKAFVIYHLSGSTTDGCFKIVDNDYSKKCAIILDNLTMSNSDGACINIQSGKRAFIRLKGSSTLADGGSSYVIPDGEDMKGTIFSEGQLIFSDYGDNDGSLTVSSKVKNGIVSDDYIMFRPNIVVNVTSTSNHGIKSNDGIIIKGGVINSTVSATATKAIKTDGYILVDGGRTTVITSGASEYDSDDNDMSSSAGIKCDSTFTIKDGSIYAYSSGAGGKGINSDQTINIDGGVIHVVTEGARAYYNGNQNIHTSPKGIKSDTEIIINGGETWVYTKGSGDGPECIESKGTLTMTGGTFAGVSESEDVMNTSGNMTFTGGYVFALSMGNDAIDSNSKLSISGGTIVAVGSGSPETAFDCDNNSNFTFTGGTIIGLGGETSGQFTYPSNPSQCLAAISASWTKGSYITVNDSEGNNIMAFQVPNNAVISSGGLIFSSPNLKQGSTYTVTSGASVSNTTNEFFGFQTGATLSSTGSTIASITFSSNLYASTGGMSGGGNSGPGGNMGGGGGPGR